MRRVKEAKREEQEQEEDGNALGRAERAEATHNLKHP